MYVSRAKRGVWLKACEARVQIDAVLMFARVCCLFKTEHTLDVQSFVYSNVVCTVFRSVVVSLTSGVVTWWDCNAVLLFACVTARFHLISDKTGHVSVACIGFYQVRVILCGEFDTCAAGVLTV